jgi:hypothetical protein
MTRARRSIGGVLCLFLLIYCSCPGDLSLPPDGSQPFDHSVNQDKTKYRYDKALAQDAPSSDTTPLTPDTGSLSGCSTWSTWTCSNMQWPQVWRYVCTSSCSANNRTYQLNCVQNGQCICENKTCGPFTYNSFNPCEACRAAVESSCCAP